MAEKEKSPPPGRPVPGAKKAPGREQRLARALRDNLKKRKLQARGRGQGPGSGSGP